mgnify:CR=1 FL=1
MNLGDNYMSIYRYLANSLCNIVVYQGGCLDLVRTAKLVLDEYFSLSTAPLNADTQVLHTRGVVREGGGDVLPCEIR